MDNKNIKPSVIVIVGPTASGKTCASIQIAKALNGEIISADSMQIYEEMDIGTAKPTNEEMSGIKHHMISIVKPNETFNVAKYKEMAEIKIEEILKRGKMPIVVGGTGLYVDTLVNSIEFSDIKEDLEYKKFLYDKFEKEGAKSLHDELKNIDEESAQKIDMNNVRRVIRALEIYKVTGKTKTQLDKESIREPKYNFKLYGIQWPREELYARIEKRIDIMLESGLIDEVASLIKKYDFSKTAVQGLGYKEVIEFLKKECTYDEMVEKLKMETRRYAKRQLTWFKRNKNITWCDINSIVDKVISENKN